jgi:hypothetical protein
MSSDHAHGHGELRSTTPGMEPEVFAMRADVVFAPPAPAGEVRRSVEAFLRDLRDTLAAAGCVLVGHVKGTLHVAGHDSLTFSLTSLGTDAPVAAQGDDIGAALLTSNAIVFGVPEPALAKLVARAWGSRIAATTTWLP